jgi:adenylate kinase
LEPRLRIHPVTGPPGAGKTTALISLERRHRALARFGVRDYGLELAEAGNPLGLKMRDTLLHGELVADDLVRQEFTHFLEHLPGEVGCVAVEGYPRDLRQCADLAEVVATAGARLAELVVVEVPDDVVRARVMDRRICTGCGLPAASAATEGCPACGGAVARRHDDAAERLDQRLKEFRTVSGEVRSYFARRRLLHVIDGRRGADEVRNALRSLLLPAGLG